mmetsp:Transcript_13385/g.18296  ORF Transcript_13385/g.18296 Transcript_13385/m.18296 type:complete len:87 (+) Transcript_13385:300-560(+)|eukprot:CAMPEP_0196582472 /NCGR_PEP_ID=MMETSP1081-20130531/39023_1 /TAXON_ID=36882 /ORGANISM="Pyramimonas amylifera, Strain CCMP720" /LENGTH=86 /DNA_ID=CAMNT_0041903035 /DNA_START=298 /DNA_END=558 /DNA_ORIENTATION=-
MAKDFKDFDNGLIDTIQIPYWSAFYGNALKRAKLDVKQRETLILNREGKNGKLWTVVTNFEYLETLKKQREKVEKREAKIQELKNK